jgi:ubiquinone/menaquinone biosynthesis C-methylase UbiE
MAEHVCPVWIGYLLASPLRKLMQNPAKILEPHIRPGMATIDVGCAMGFFSLPMGRLVGPDGKVICIDIQEKMLETLKKRAAKAGLADRMDIRVCPQESLGIDDLAGQVDVALAFAVAHEMPDSGHMLREIFAALKPGGRLLLAEPKGHVSADNFDKLIATALQTGFSNAGAPRVRRSHAVILDK